MSGSFAEQFKSRIDENKNTESSRDKLADKFNQTASVLIDEFLREVSSNNIRIDDTADLMRLFQIYFEINDLQSMSGEGSGRLPELSMRQSKQIQSFVDTQDIETPEGDRESIVDPESLAGLSEDDIGDLMLRREEGINKDNADIWGEGTNG